MTPPTSRPTFNKIVYRRSAIGKIIRDPTTKAAKIRTATLEFAGTDELLEFANRVREAGGAKFLDRLLPSNPNEPSNCLIANALNFDCEVDGYVPEGSSFETTHVPPYDTGNPDADQWAMRTTIEVAEKLADSLGLPFDLHPDGDSAYVLLPEHIGNAAAAFDEYVDEFEEYVE